MSSTEQKNVTQPFINASHTFGILPALITGAFTRYGLETENLPFSGLGPTGSLGVRLLKAEDPLDDARRLLPVLRSAPCVNRVSPFLLRICSDSYTFSGNQATIRLCEGILNNRWCLHFTDTNAIKHARRHTPKVCAYLSPGAYGQARRTFANVRKLAHKGESSKFRSAADIFDYLSKGPRNGDHQRQIQRWCNQHRDKTGFNSRYRREKEAVRVFREFNSEAIHNCDEPPSLKQKWITTSKSGPVTLSIYHYASTYYIKIKQRYPQTIESTLSVDWKRRKTQVERRHLRKGHELYILSYRDLQDLVFLLNAAANIKLYHHRRLRDVSTPALRSDLLQIQISMWARYKEVLMRAGNVFELRNKVGVYFDVLQWRYLAWKSGDLFYNHSYIMGQKISSKGLEDMPSQDPLLTTLKKLPMDMAVDMLGMYKASIYPEVDPFKVVCDQYRLHYSRHQTSWEEGSEEHQRFEDTRSYMWYLGIRVLNAKRGTWPGQIREGIGTKPWHATYKTKGIPGNQWRDAHDVDLTGTVVVADITEEQYMKQQDSACAPPLWQEYENYDAMSKAPRRHRRKLLYSIQEAELPSLIQILSDLNDIGSELADGHVDPVDYRPKFSTDIVTGSRCERHKDAPRPFYAASPPWGCILSYIDGITRDFLNNVPQSMLGKSTRQKFTDLSATVSTQEFDEHTFYMSDDKAKYSPRMDPQSQQLPAEFFAELFDIPAIKAVGPIMYHNNLYYRVNGHLVSYASNGTDREGMRGASNTWLEIVAQGLSTRLCRERGLIRGKSTFLSFIDDGLRKFSIETRSRKPHQYMDAAKLVINDVIFGLKVLGRELSWDKTFISRDLFVILNELVYDGSFISSGLKSFCTAGDVELKEVMSSPDYEQLYFGKMRGAHGVGTPLDLCHYNYVFETLVSHYKMGVNLQDNKDACNLDYRLFCVTPVSLGGGGLRTQLQIGCNEVASATKEGVGNILRLGNDYPLVMYCVRKILSHPMEPLNPVDFMREPEQMHTAGPRLKTQRLAAEVRSKLKCIARNDLSRMYIEQDEAGVEVLRDMGKALMATGDVSAEEIRLIYSSSPVAFIDEFIQKLASSVTLAELLGNTAIKAMRRLVRIDIIKAVAYFQYRCHSRELLHVLSGDINRLALLQDLIY